jgi:hypothetical protein
MGVASSRQNSSASTRVYDRCGRRNPNPGAAAEMGTIPIPHVLKNR